MKRKVIKLGTATNVVSLPSQWIKKYGIRAGDEIDVNEQGKNLTISTKKDISGERKVIIVEKSQEFLNRFISIPYQYGYDEIEVRFEDPSVIPLIQEHINLLLGFEIVDQGEKHVIIQMVAKGIEGDFDKLLRRFMLILVNMSKEIAAAVTNKDKNKLVEISSMEKITNKLSNFCARMLNKHGYEDTRKTNFLFCFSWAAEQIGDSLRDICKIMLERDLYKKGISEDTLNLLVQFSELMESYSKLFYNITNEGIILFKNSNSAMEKNIYKVIDSKPEEEKKILFQLLKMNDLLKHLSISLI